MARTAMFYRTRICSLDDAPLLPADLKDELRDAVGMPCSLITAYSSVAELAKQGLLLPVSLEDAVTAVRASGICLGGNHANKAQAPTTFTLIKGPTTVEVARTGERLACLQLNTWLELSVPGYSVHFALAAPVGDLQRLDGEALWGPWNP